MYQVEYKWLIQLPYRADLAHSYETDQIDEIENFQITKSGFWKSDVDFDH